MSSEIWVEFDCSWAMSERMFYDPVDKVLKHRITTDRNAYYHSDRTFRNGEDFQRPTWPSVHACTESPCLICMDYKRDNFHRFAPQKELYAHIISCTVPPSVLPLIPSTIRHLTLCSSMYDLPVLQEEVKRFHSLTYFHSKIDGDLIPFITNPHMIQSMELTMRTTPRSLRKFTSMRSITFTSPTNPEQFSNWFDMFPRHDVMVSVGGVVFPDTVHRGWSSIYYSVWKVHPSKRVFDIKLKELKQSEQVIVALLAPKQRVLPVEIIRGIWDMLYV